METILRSAAVYFFLLLIFNVAPKRALSGIDTFDLVLILIISEAAQNALVGENFSLTNSFLVITTLVSLALIMGWLKIRFNRVEKVLSGGPLVVVQNGQCFAERMRKSRVDDQDVLEAARMHHGLERLDQIKFAIVESDGSISIIPTER